MFSKQGVATLFNNHKNTLKSLARVEERLNKRFINMHSSVLCLLLAVASGEAMLLIGPPGTAKSRLIRAFCQIIGLIDDAEMEDTSQAIGDNRKLVNRSGQYFEYLLTPFTEPSELFGYFDIAELQKNNNLVRNDAGMMQHARIVFLDEVFNASSAILNSLLTFMNERKFHDRGLTIHVPLQCLLSATNDVPTSSELRAFFDRYLLRNWLSNEPPVPENMGRLLNAGWNETHAPPRLAGVKSNDEVENFKGLLPKLTKLRVDIDNLSRDGKLKVEADHSDFRKLAGLVENIRAAGLSEMSNRRLVKMAKVMLIHRLFCAAKEGGDKPSLAIKSEDRFLLVKFGLDAHGDDFERRLSIDPSGI